MPIDLHPIQSSNISAAGHDEKENILAIKFKDGALYHYHDVPKDVYETLIGAKSVGSHFHSTIKGNYKHSKQ